MLFDHQNVPKMLIGLTSLSFQNRVVDLPWRKPSPLCNLLSAPAQPLNNHHRTVRQAMNSLLTITAK